MRDVQFIFHSVEPFSFGSLDCSKVSLLDVSTGELVDFIEIPSYLPAERLKAIKKLNCSICSSDFISVPSSSFEDELFNSFEVDKPLNYNSNYVF